MKWRSYIFSDLGILVLLAILKLIFHTLTNGQYGFFRDELGMIDDARFLDWGYVSYPPLTPFIARIALEIFGTSLVGLRFFAALAQCIVLVLAGWMARELGGNRHTQILAAITTALAPVALGTSALFEYVTFDFLWWVLIAYLVIRLIKSDDARWWIGIGAVIGLGMMTKYTMGFFVLGIVAGVLITATRQHLKSKWLWIGVAISILVFLPNLIWQIQHNFISLEFLGSIHERDIRIGRTDEFWSDQLLTSANPAAVPILIAGLIFYFFSAAGKRYRMIGWMAMVTFAIFWIAQGRGYYTAPIYPMITVGGAVLIQQWCNTLPRLAARSIYGVVWGLLVIGGILVGAIALPLAPINSEWWKIANEINGDLREEFGWEELTQTVAEIYNTIPASEKSRAGILAGNYGEAGAINLYGTQYGLPRAISGINSYWLRGYGNPPPETVVVVGVDEPFMYSKFESCTIAGRITNRYNVLNEETRDHPNIFICRKLKQSWDEFWKSLKHFG